MNLFSIDIGYLILILFLINFMGVLLIRSQERFWLPGIALWIFLFFIVVMLNVINRTDVDRQEIIYGESTANPEKMAQNDLQLEQLKKEKNSENTVLFHLLGFQTIFSCIWQFLGYRSTGKKYYRTSSITFTFLVFVYLFIVVTQIVL
jgi:hypothetical protein